MDPNVVSPRNSPPSLMDPNIDDRELIYTDSETDNPQNDEDKNFDEENGCSEPDRPICMQLLQRGL